MTEGHLTLTADGVSRAYAGKYVVESADLELEPGKITALLGASGAGKSTLLRLLAGLEPVDAGQIRLGEEILSSTSRHVPAEQRRIGLVFQDFALFPHLNALDNVGFGLSHRPKAERRDIAGRWLEQLGLSKRANAYPHQLSGGEQQRVSIARALAAEPVAILMDEPFSGLDVTLKSEVRRIALDAVLQANIPALLVSHDAHEAMRDADRIAVMKDGRVLQVDTPEQLYLQPNSRAVASALGPVHEVSVQHLPAAWRNGREDGTLWLRPEAIRLDPAGNGEFRVASAKRTSTIIELTLENGNGEQLRAVSMGPIRPEAGDTVRASFSPEFAFSLPSA